MRRTGAQVLPLLGRLGGDLGKAQAVRLGEEELLFMTNWHQRALTNINKHTYGDLLLLVPELYFNKAFEMI